MTDEKFATARQGCVPQTSYRVPADSGHPDRRFAPASQEQEITPTRLRTGEAPHRWEGARLWAGVPSFVANCSTRLHRKLPSLPIEQSVLLSAASVYMDVLRDSANLELQRDNVDVLRQTLKVVQDRYNVGAVTGTDLDQAQAQLASGEASLHSAESTLMTTKANYRRIIGTEPQGLSPGMPVDRFSPRTLDAAVA
jgi:hypothetical protein